MSTVTFTTDLNNKIKMGIEDFKATVVETIDFAINEKGYNINDLTIDFIAEDITGVIKSWGNVEHGMNSVGLVVIKDVLSEIQSNHKIEQHWVELADIPFDDVEGGDLVLAENWLHFEKGTEREGIWHWFDEQHTQGVAYLLNEFEEA